MSVEYPEGSRAASDRMPGWLNVPAGREAYRRGTSPRLLCRVCGAQMVWTGTGYMRCMRADGGSCDAADPDDRLYEGDPRVERT